MRAWFVILFFGVFSIGCGNGGSLVKKTNESPESSEPPRSTADTGSQAESNSDSGAGTNVTWSPDAENADASPIVANGDVQQSPSDEVEVINFDDLNLGMPIDSRFRPIMLEYNEGRAKELLGRVVNIGGYMNPPDQLRGLTEFVLLKNTECKFGPGGQADHLARVYMKEGSTVDYTNKVIYVEGRIRLKPFPDDSPMTWSIYDIEATNVTTRAPSRER